MDSKRTIIRRYCAVIAIPAAVTYSAIELPFVFLGNLLELNLGGALLSVPNVLVNSVERAIRWSHNLGQELIPEKVFKKENGETVSKRIIRTREGKNDNKKFTLKKGSKLIGVLEMTKKLDIGPPTFCKITKDLVASEVIKTTDGVLTFHGNKESFRLQRKYNRQGKYVGSNLQNSQKKSVVGEEKKCFIEKLNRFKNKDLERDLIRGQAGQIERAVMKARAKEIFDSWYK